MGTLLRRTKRNILSLHDALDGLSDSIGGRAGRTGGGKIKGISKGKRKNSSRERQPGNDVQKVRSAVPRGADPAPAQSRDAFVAANRLVAEGRLAEAEAAYAELLKITPTSPSLLHKLGDLNLQKGQPRAALDWYDRAIEADSDSPWPHIGRGEILSSFDDVEGAVAALQRALALDPSLTFVAARIAELQRTDVAATDLYWPASAPPTAAKADHGPRPRIAFIAWDLGHNAMGRALTLAEMAARIADCELVGPMFPRYGGSLWRPLQTGPRVVPIRGFKAEGIADLIDEAIRIVEANPCDVAWVSKARFPGLLLAFLYRALHGAWVILDLDDDELAMVGADEPLSFDRFVTGGAPPDWDIPFGRAWTQLAQSMVPWADAVTVCNPVLRERHGGILIRHARSEAAFDAAVERRQELRAEFGFAPSDRVVLFLGTAHRHKGIERLVGALEAIGDPRAVLCIAGSVPDRTLADFLDGEHGVRIKRLAEQPMARVADINAMADIVCLLQEGDSRIALSQTPAKLTDALASGTTVLATPLPPIMDLVEEGAITTVSDADLTDRLRDVLVRDGDAAKAAARRAFFHRELSFAANLPRVAEAIDTARRSRKRVPDDFFKLLNYIELNVPGGLSRHAVAFLNETLPRFKPVAPLVSTQVGMNVIFFWKQNDSGLFGRRQDMILRELARSPRVNRILHVEAPISIDSLTVADGDPAGDGQSQARLVSANVAARFLEAQDDDRVYRRSFVFGNPGQTLFGRPLPAREDFAETVQGWLAALGMTDNLLAWVCPVVLPFPHLQRRLGFSFVVTDVIDDQRKWPMRSTYRAAVEACYRDTFAVTDLAFANCAPVAEWVSEAVGDVTLVPNGIAAPPPDVDTWSVPAALARLSRPIIGYAGNLTQRIDWPLLTGLADARPDWSVVLIGTPPQPSKAFEQLCRRANVHVLGPIPHERAQRFIAAFDVAIVPHLVNAISERMNPLKILVYRSLGLPVVSSPIPNVNDLADEVVFAEGTEAFIAAVARAIDTRRNEGRVYPARWRDLSWDARMETMFEAIDRRFAEKAAS